MKDVKTENAIKRLEETQKNVSPELKKNIEDKINALKSGKTIHK